MNIRPLQDVVVVRLDPPEKLSSIIEVPDTKPNPVQKGTVLRVGPGRHKLKKAGKQDKIWVPTTVQPGERIVFPAAAIATKEGKQLQYLLDDNIALIRESDIFFVFEGDVKVEV